jgi:hypothetical protein
VVSVMLFLATRDPERNVGVVDDDGGALHTRGHAAHFPLHAGCAEALSGLSDLGALFGEVGACRCPLLFAAAGGALETRGKLLRKDEAEVYAKRGGSSSTRQVPGRWCEAF